jgi:hypothetical protein
MVRRLTAATRIQPPSARRSLGNQETGIRQDYATENPDKAADAKATELAALESVLKTYQAILKQKPDAKAKPLDDLVKKQSQGKLQEALKQCS